MNSRVFFGCLSLFVGILCCFMSVASASTSSVPNGGFNMLEISTRPWLYELSSKYGKDIHKLSDVPLEEVKRWKTLGYDMIWLMGAWQLGPYGLNHDKTDPGLLASFKQALPDFVLDDVIGSPYAVYNYTCNSEFGSDNDLRAFRSTLNGMGLKLMLDFVPNHSAVDCPHVQTDPKMYISCPSPPCDSDHFYQGKIAYGGTGLSGYTWTDTLQFNYWDDTCRSIRQDEVLKVASFADAIRCDMAALITNDDIAGMWGDILSQLGCSRPSSEFWSDAISAAKAKYPDVVFLAEVYHPDEYRLQQMGFDFTYEKFLYDKLNAGDMSDLKNYLSNQDVSYTRHCAHFASNHDEVRAIAEFGSWQRADAALAVSMTLPGMRFYWMWEDLGFANRLLVQLRREKKEDFIANVTDFHHKLLQITSDDVFRSGNYKYLSVNNECILSFGWESGDEKRLVAINYCGNSQGDFVVVSNAKGKGGSDDLVIAELFSGTKYTRSASAMRTKGLYVGLDAWQTQIFSY